MLSHNSFVRMKYVSTKFLNKKKSVASMDLGRKALAKAHRRS